MDYDTLGRLIREALEHLNSRPCLATHPLGALLSDDGRPLSGEGLRRKLLEMIDQARPVADTVSHPSDWRLHRHLVLRYVEGQTRDHVARTLAISPRQASRDHEQAIAILTRALWRSIGAKEGGVGDAGIDGAVSDESDVAAATSAARRFVAGGDDRSVLADTLSGVLATINGLVTDRDVRFTLAVPDTLPAVAMNSILLRQALLNVLMYAAQLRPAVDLRLSAADSSAGIVLSVDVLARTVGDRETPRSESSTRTDDPAGIRALVTAGQELLRMQGGSVALAPAESGEPVLTIVLPPVALRTVLVVDDNPDVVGLFRRYLRDKPYRLIQATCATSALSMAQDIQPEAIILDVILPATDGWDVLQQLRGHALTRGIPVIVCSVLPEKALAQSAGAQIFLAKPVTRGTLLDALERCAGTHRWSETPVSSA